LNIVGFPISVHFEIISKYEIKYLNKVSMFLAILSLLLLSVAIVMGGYTNVKTKEDGEEQEQEPEPVPTNNDPQTTEEVNETEPEPAPEPINCVGKWGEWSPCSVGSIECELNSDGEGGIPPIGVQKRDWITITKAENGGKACVYDINKDGAKACKGVCNKDVQICYSCGYKNCKVFKIGSGADVSGAAPLNGVTSIKIPYGRKIDFWWRDPEGRVAPPQRVVEETGASGNFEFSPCTPIQIVGLRISEKLPSEY
jgi:hypothetical protein